MLGQVNKYIIYVCIVVTAIPGEIYLASDGSSITRHDICAATVSSGLFPGASMPKVWSLTVNFSTISFSFNSLNIPCLFSFFFYCLYCVLYIALLNIL